MTGKVAADSTVLLFRVIPRESGLNVFLPRWRSVAPLRNLAPCRRLGAGAEIRKGELDQAHRGQWKQQSEPGTAFFCPGLAVSKQCRDPWPVAWASGFQLCHVYLRRPCLVGGKDDLVAGRREARMGMGVLRGVDLHRTIIIGKRMGPVIAAR